MNRMNQILAGALVVQVGLALLLMFKLQFDPSFYLVDHIFGTPEREGELNVLLNLLGLLTGFAILAKHFQDSKVPLALPQVLPDDWKAEAAAEPQRIKPRAPAP